MGCETYRKFQLPLPKAVADYLVAISWQTRISELLISGVVRKQTEGFTYQNELSGNSSLFSVSSNSVLGCL